MIRMGFASGFIKIYAATEHGSREFSKDVASGENGMSSEISIVEFKSRLAVLCLSGGGRGLSRKWRDQQILFKSTTLLLEPNQDYTESDLNECLEKWLSQVGQTVELDHVTLRRYLVDAGYLTRDPAGRHYRMVPEPSPGLFEAGIAEIDPMAVIEEASQEAEQRKWDYLKTQVKD